MVLRRILHVLACAAILCATADAAADPGRVVLVGGRVVTGDIRQVVDGEFVVVQLPNGKVEAYGWPEIVSISFDSTAQPAPPAPVYQPTPPPPPVYTGAPPPYPAPVFVPPPAPPRFEPALTLGVRAGSMTVGGDVYGAYDPYYGYAGGPRLRMADVASWGYLFQGDLGFHFSPSWTVYGFWEHGELDDGDLNRGWASTNAVGVGIHANTSPYGPLGIYVDAGAAYRWMRFADATAIPNAPVTTSTTASGVDYLRLAIGVSIRISRRFRLDPHLFTNSGYFNEYDGTGCAGCGIDARALDSGFRWFSGFAVAARWDLLRLR